jgi:hypothetical protein
MGIKHRWSMMVESFSFPHSSGIKAGKVTAAPVAGRRKNDYEKSENRKVGTYLHLNGDETFLVPSTVFLVSSGATGSAISLVSATSGCWQVDKHSASDLKRFSFPFVRKSFNQFIMVLNDDEIMKLTLQPPKINGRHFS